MRKGEIPITLMMQIFRIIVAVLLLLGAISLVSRVFFNNDANVSDGDFKSINLAIKELNEGSHSSTALILLNKDQFGVFFRADSSEFAQIINDCWDRYYVDTTAGSGKEISNPENNCLLDYVSRFKKIPLVISKPAVCDKDNACFCTFIRQKTDFLKKRDYSIILDSKSYPTFYELQFSKVNCKPIDKTPSKKHHSKYEQDSVGMLGLGPIPKIITATEDTINIGGTLMAPVNGESYSYYFCEDPDDKDAFFVAKYELQCYPKYE